MKKLILILLLASCATPKKVAGPVMVMDGGTYDSDVVVLVTEDLYFAASYVHDNLDTNVTVKDFDARGVTFTSPDGAVIVWLPNTKDTSIISHELFHATAAIMRWAGVPFTEDTEEAFAYELQYLTKQFYARRIN